MFRPAMAAMIVCSLLAAPALAQQHEGRWEGAGEGQITLDLSHIQNDIYAISINTIVPISEMSGCAGGVDGEVSLDSTGGNFFVENEGYDASFGETPMNQRYCEISLTFNQDGTLTTEEKTGCLYYHGAACGFSGTLDHEAAGI